MADNKTANAGAGGATFATDEIAGVDWPFAKLAWGPRDTANEVDDAAGKALPVKIAEVGSVSFTVTGPLTDAQLRATPVPVSGSVTALTGAERAEDSAHSTGQTGMFVLGVRSELGTLMSDTDQDYTPLIVDRQGRLIVAGVQIHDTALSAGIDRPFVGGGRGQNTLPTAVSADGDAVYLWTTLNGAPIVAGFDGTNPRNIRTDTSGNVRVDPTGTTTQPVSIAATVTVQGSGTFTVADSNLDNATLVDNAAFTDGTTRLMMSGFILDEVAGTALAENDAAAARINANRAVVAAIEDGATRARYATVTAANALKVDGSAVTQPVSGTVTANQGTAGTAWEMVGDIAHDAAGAAVQPVLHGGYASAAAPADVSADNDAVRAWYLRNGAQATVLTAAGALIGGDAANGLDVDVTRVTGTVTTKEARSATGTQTSVTASASSVTILASNANRLNARIHNASTDSLFIRYQATASSTNYSERIDPGGTIDVPSWYTGIIDGLWDGTNGAAKVTEFT